MGGAKSTWSEMVKGVPQGSILAPLLFTIFMNDLPSVIENCNVNLYADDTTVYFSSKDHQEVQEVLEAELRAVAHSVQLRLAQFFLGESVQVAPASTRAPAFI